MNELQQKQQSNIGAVIARLFFVFGIMIWFIIVTFGWIIPIALQNDGYSINLQIISFTVWFVAWIVGMYLFATKTGFSLF